MGGGIEGSIKGGLVVKADLAKYGAMNGGSLRIEIGDQFAFQTRNLILELKLTLL